MKKTDLPASVAERAPHLWEKLPDVLPDVVSHGVLCLQYIRPEKSAGGVIMPPQALLEDMYQGRIGIVIGIGQDCFLNEEKFPTGPTCKLGDAILWSALTNAGQRTKFGDGLVLTVVPDTQVRAVLPAGIDLGVAMGAMSGS